MTFQRFRKISRDINDKLYSTIIRSIGIGRCRRCHFYFGFEKLQCAHIFGRGHKRTRFLLAPKFNAIPLCSDCHSWFDSHKIDALLFDEKKRVLSMADESYTWLVSTKISLNGKSQDFWNYTWNDLYKMYALSHHGTHKYGPLQKAEVKKQLLEYIEKEGIILNA